MRFTWKHAFSNFRAQTTTLRAVALTRKWTLAAAGALLLAGATGAFAQHGGPGSKQPPADPAAPKGPKAPHRRWQDLPERKLRDYKAPKAERHELENGLVVFLLEDHELPLIDLVTLVRAGSFYETRDKAGLAGICGEVMRSGGTEKLTGDELDRILEDTASSVEVGISSTEGRGSLSCLKENFESTLPVLLEILERPAFRKEKLDLAKKQAKSGIARRNDDPSGIARREYARLMYGDDHPLGWTTELATIDSITRDDLVEFHRTYFGIPNGTVVGVVGDFDSQAMLGQIKATFGKWKPAAGTIAMPPVGLAAGEGPAPKVYFVRKKDVNQATVTLGHMGVRRTPDDPDYAPMIVLNDVLGGGGFASRLLQHVRTDLGLAYGVGSRWNPHYAYKGTFGMTGQTKSETTLQMIAAIRKELETIINEPVSEAELKVAKDSLAQQMIFESDSREKVLERALRYEYYGFPQDYLDRFQAAIAKVTAADCQRVAKKYLHPERLITVVVGNDEKFDGKLATLGEVVEVDVSKPAWPKGDGAAASDGKPVEASGEALQKGHELIERAIAAKGGRQALEAVKSFKMTGSGTIVPGPGAPPMALDVVQVIAFPDRMRMEMRLPVATIVRAYDGKAGWIQAPQGVMELPESQANELKEQVEKDEIPILLALGKPGAKPLYAGKEKLDDVEYEVIEAGGGIKLYFDKDGQLARRSEKGPQGDVMAIFSDFRDVQAVKLPFGSRVLVDGEEAMKMTTSAYEINVETPVEMFAKPEGNEIKPGGGGPRKRPAGDGGAKGEGAKPPENK